MESPKPRLRKLVEGAAVVLPIAVACLAAGDTGIAASQTVESRNQTPSAIHQLNDRIARDSKILLGSSFVELVVGAGLVVAKLRRLRK